MGMVALVCRERLTASLRRILLGRTGLGAAECTELGNSNSGTSIDRKKGCERVRLALKPLRVGVVGGMGMWMGIGMVLVRCHRR